MKYLVVIGDGMADNPVEALGGKTPLEYADIPTIDSLAARGTVGSVVNCPKPLPAGSETAILSIFGCDPLKHFSGRSPMEAAAIGLRLVPGDAAFRCNLVALEPGDQPYEEKRILSHSAGSIAGQDALDVVAALNSDPEFSAALRAADMYIDPSPSFRPLAVKHHCDPSGVCFIPPHDHLGEVIGPLLPSGKDAALAKVFADLMRLANRVLEHHPVTEKRRAEGKLGANGIWFWAAGTAMQLPDFREEYGCGGAVISAVPLCHGIGVLRGLEMVEVEGATGEIDTNFEGKLEATWASLQKYDFVCLHPQRRPQGQGAGHRMARQPACQAPHRASGRGAHGLPPAAPLRPQNAHRDARARRRSRAVSALRQPHRQRARRRVHRKGRRERSLRRARLRAAASSL